mmetsp:Transcript_68208/g.79395  ORF Transcript_68208/g.79395 Transcript_68208/m.79395 type:complete len:302 (+) Transcript_68208:127-1032(+)
MSTSTSTFGVSFFNEFEDPFIIMPNLVTLECGSPLTGRITTDTDGEATHFAAADVSTSDVDTLHDVMDHDIHDEELEKDAAVEEEDRHVDIMTDTLQVCAPTVSAVVMPTSSPEACEMMATTMPDDDAQVDTAPVSTSSESTAVSSPTESVATYRHNPYRARVIKCRVIPTREDLADGPSALSDQVVPLCPCVAQSRQFSQEITPITSEGTSPITPSPLIPVRQPAAVVTAEAPKPKSMCCYFKQKGYCKMGDKCWHGHEGDLYTPCHYGAECKAGHATLIHMQQQQQRSRAGAAASLWMA